MKFAEFAALVAAVSGETFKECTDTWDGAVDEVCKDVDGDICFDW